MNVVKDGWYRLLFWQKNISYFLRLCKKVCIIKFLKKCPSCFSKKIDFVEGNNMLSKWFCRDCTAMHYAFRCLYCNKKLWFFGHFKKHIYREYRLGKYKTNKFFTGVKDSYFIGQIYFHEQALNEWKKRYKEFKRYKKMPKYGV